MVRAAETALMAAWPGLNLTVEKVARPADAALLARAEGAEMLVLGSSGHGAVAGFLLGSVGHQVLSRATCPVVMVRADGVGGGGQGAGEVVVGLRELDRSTGPLLRFAAGAAEARETSVRVLHAWNVPPEVHHHRNALRVVDEDGPTAHREEEALAATVSAWQHGLPPRTVQEVVRGSPSDALAEASRNAAVVVVGRKVRHPCVGMRIGPVAHSVLQRVAVPVAVVPHG
jgi:nucleotide-binding universal stress UspA family protein